MAEHVPTTDEVRERFIVGAINRAKATGFSLTLHIHNKAREDFDRWLAEVRREAAEKAAVEVGVCEHQNANYLAMMSERDALRAEVERLRREVAAGIETERGSNATARRLLAEAREQVADLRAGIEALRDRAARLGLDEAAEDANTLLAGSGEQPGERERAWLNADPDAAKQNLHTILDILGPDESRDPDAAPMSGEEVRWRPAPVAPDSADVRERVAMLVRLSRIADRAWEARRSDAGFQEDVERLTDAVLAVVGPSGKGQVDG